MNLSLQTLQTDKNMFYFVTLLCFVRSTSMTEKIRKFKLKSIFPPPFFLGDPTLNIETRMCRNKNPINLFATERKTYL